MTDLHSTRATRKTLAMLVRLRWRKNYQYKATLNAGLLCLAICNVAVVRLGQIGSWQLS